MPSRWRGQLFNFGRFEEAGPGASVAGPAPPAKKNSRRWWLIAGSLLTILAIVAASAYCRRKRPPENVTARVDRGDIDFTVTTTGNL